MKKWNAELSRRLDLAVATVEALEEGNESFPNPGQEKAVVKWKGIKSKLERTIFDDDDTGSK